MPLLSSRVVKRGVANIAATSKRIDTPIVAAALFISVIAGICSVFFGFSNAFGTVVGLTSIFIILVLYYLVLGIPLGLQERRTRVGGINPALRVIESKSHLIFKNNDFVEYERSLVVVAITHGIGSYNFKLSWQGDENAISILNCVKCKIEILQENEDVGIHCSAKFDNNLVPGREHEFSFRISFDNSSKQIKNFLASTAPYKPERLMQLKATLAKTPKEFHKTIYLSRLSENVVDRVVEIQSKNNRSCEWNIIDPSYDYDYRLTWKY